MLGWDLIDALGVVLGSRGLNLDGVFAGAFGFGFGCRFDNCDAGGVEVECLGVLVLVELVLLSRTSMDSRVGFHFRVERRVRRVLVVELDGVHWLLC